MNLHLVKLHKMTSAFVIVYNDCILMGIPLKVTPGLTAVDYSGESLFCKMAIRDLFSPY